MSGPLQIAENGSARIFIELTPRQAEIVNRALHAWEPVPFNRYHDDSAKRGLYSFTPEAKPTEDELNALITEVHHVAVLK